MLDGTMIYVKMEPDLSFDILAKSAHSKLSSLKQNESFMVWLMRESRIPGCLTIDCIKYKKADKKESILNKKISLRFIYVKTPEGNLWKINNDRKKCLELQENDQAVYLYSLNIDNESHAHELASLVEKIQDRGFEIDSYVFPNRQQASRNEAYSGYSQSNYIVTKAKKSTSTAELEQLAAELEKLRTQIRKDDTCSITQNPVWDSESFAIEPSGGHVFDCDAIEQWLQKNPTNPLTREVLYQRDLLITSAPLKRTLSISKSEEKINEKIKEMSDSSTQSKQEIPIVKGRLT